MSEPSELSYIQFLRFAIAEEIAAQHKYFLENSRISKLDPNIHTESWHCGANGCKANFLVYIDQYTYNLHSIYSVHNHNDPDQPTNHHHASSFLKNYIATLLKAGVPSQSILTQAYRDLRINIQESPYLFLTISENSLSKQRRKLRPRFKYADEELNSLQIFTNIVHSKSPEDFIFFRSTESGYLWAYSSSKGKELARNAKEWHIDSTYAVTNRRSALYAIVVATPEGHGFPVLYALAEPDNADSISEILSAFTNELGQIQLTCIVSDCAKQEHAAILRVFGSNFNHRWCSFHVLRAIKANRSNFDFYTHYQKFFTAMRQLSTQILTTEEIQQNKALIADSYRTEGRARKYYLKNWTKNEQLWVRTYQPDASTTNNFSEGHFKSLKYRHLGKRSDFRVDELAVKLVTEIVPDFHTWLLNDQIQAGKMDTILPEPEEDEPEEQKAINLEAFTANAQHYIERIFERVGNNELDTQGVLNTLQALATQ